jgi:hypothetical protein
MRHFLTGKYSHRTLASSLQVIVLSVAMWGAPVAHATLIGDTFSATGSQLVTNFSTIGAGAEATGIGGRLDFDFGASSLTVTQTQSLLSFSVFGNYVFSGLDWVGDPTGIITGITIASNDGFTGGLVNNFSFTDHSITFNLDPGTSTPGIGKSVVFNIVTNHSVPEPTILALFGLGLAGLGFSRRRKV